MTTTFIPLADSERQVLDAVRIGGELSRARIADVTGFAPPLITLVTRDLIARGLILEREPVRGSRGQPARPLAINPEGAYAFGVTFTTQRVTVGLLGLTGGLQSQETVLIERFSISELLRSMRGLITRLQRKSAVDMSRVIGIGINVPATASSRRGYFHTHDYFAELRGIDLLSRLQVELPFSVVIETDPVCAAIGERMHGAGRDLDSFFQIHVAFRFGGALMLNGHPYRGAHGNAGVIGITFPIDEPRPSGQDLLEHLAGEGLAVSDFADLATLNWQNCQPLDAWLTRAAGQLGKSIELVSRFYDPEAIIVGGRIPPLLIQTLLDRIDLAKVFDYSKHIPAPLVLPSMMADQAGLIGAASAPMQIYLSPDRKRLI